jgi:glycogen operon protein
VHQDPAVSRCKLVAEPWDMGDHGYQVGGFPVPWSEWNDRYRNGVRDFWRGGGPGIGDLAFRLTGSSDLYRWSDGRRPPASVNFVTAHDGFTLTDLVSYDRKHNEANQEGNADGTDDNRSWNCGAEGPTTDPAVTELRQRQRRNLLATLLFSQGVPMLLGGDEMGRTQQGNNNAYCQDNAVSWYDWDPAGMDADLLAFTTSCIALRGQHPVFRRRSFFQGRPIHEGSADDVDWLGPDGEELTHDDWVAGGTGVLGMYLNGGGIDEPDARGGQVSDDCFLLLFNASATDVAFLLPGPPWAGSYEPVVDTRLPRGVPEGPDADKLPAAAQVTLVNRSFLMLRAIPEPG